MYLKKNIHTTSFRDRSDAAVFETEFRKLYRMAQFLGNF